ncbi:MULTISPECIES: RraA family protein [unclassified Symbiopectobacterium]|uniref:RraA family protein n=1 Tax=unclassified Symbiopectobacterium TaxID=2794573 RepID=UPI00222631B6|nr:MULTISPECIES: RraA family protein [unclassified Symbiopectobacterium]MCW2476754.1 RraA family protein [Candidatus Symbiopectobacterium sp. NZEC151]MCW2488000.1 RraA family protein [Candidatus Symbiopectobacterium sp. NZEC127]
MSIGNRIFTQRPAFDIELLQHYEQLPAANIADTMNRIAVLGNGIKRISSPKKPIMAGYAITVKVRAGDNLMLHAALDMASEHDVIVVSNEGDRSRALMGEIMVAYAHCTKKIAGIVLDGPIRDVDALSVLDFPLFATGSNPAGPFKEGPGEVNTPIAVGGVAVCPGDLIVGDADGVIVIPLKDAATLLDKAKEYSKFDASKVDAAKNGTANRAWVKKSLEAKGVEFINDIFR